MITKALKFIPGKGYNELVRNTKVDLAQLENLVRTQTALVMWNLGKSAHEHLLKNKDKAGYGHSFFENFAKDIDRDISTVQRAVQFYLTYPIPAAERKLTWEHYKSLLPIKDKAERKRIEDKIIRYNWNTKKLKEYLSIKHQLEYSRDAQQLIPQLEFTRGKPFVYRIIEVVDDKSGQTSLRLDLGFKVGRPIKEDFKKDDFVEAEGPNEECELTQVTVLPDEIFTYKASVVKVIDGDTLTVDMDTGLNEFIGKKLRLRGIDCPEMDTDEGKHAKRFVETRLKPCEFIIVKTYKDRSDMWDRYLADVFYAQGQADPQKAAQDGAFLNQELLDKGLARIFV